MFARQQNWFLFCFVVLCCVVLCFIDFPILPPPPPQGQVVTAISNASHSASVLESTINACRPSNYRAAIEEEEVCDVGLQLRWGVDEGLHQQQQTEEKALPLQALAITNRREDQALRTSLLLAESHQASLALNTGGFGGGGEASSLRFSSYLLFFFVVLFLYLVQKRLFSINFRYCRVGRISDHPVECSLAELENKVDNLQHSIAPSFKWVLLSIGYPKQSCTFGSKKTDFSIWYMSLNRPHILYLDFTT
mgnify:CR=1 FL=1